jgi:broad specificity phosphatase PhoE
MTAEVVAAGHDGLHIVFEDSLRERHFGIWEGLRFNEIESQFPLEYKAWKQDQAIFKPDRGESVYDLAERVVPAVKEMVARHRGETVLIVTHVGPIRVLVAEALGMPVELYRRLRVDPASITVVDYGDLQNNLILMNFHAGHMGCATKMLCA